MVTDVWVRDESCYPEDLQEIAPFREALRYAVKHGYLTEEEKEQKYYCLVEYLNQYVNFAQPESIPNRQLNMLYNKTLFLLRNSIEYRESNMDKKVKEEVENWKKILSLFRRGKETEEELKDSIYSELLQRLNFLKDMEKTCKKATSRIDKVLCIERFAISVHQLGPFLVEGCGLTNDIYPYPQYVSILYPDLEDAAVEISKSTLGCLGQGASPSTMERLYGF